jgi:hypothetical protein
VSNPIAITHHHLSNLNNVKRLLKLAQVNHEKITLTKNATLAKNAPTKTTEREDKIMEYKDIALTALTQFQDMYGSGKAFIMEQAPLVIQEYITITMIETGLDLLINLCWLAFMFVLFIMLYRGVVKDTGLFGKKGTCPYNDKSYWPMERVFGVGLTAVIVFAVTCCNIGSTIDHAKVLAKIKYAPRVFMIEKAAELTKTLTKR